jgi:hypothetical protein
MERAMSEAWRRIVRLHELARGPLTLQLEPDAAERAQVAHQLGLESLPSLKAEVTVRPWLDGAELAGRFEAVVEQLCSLTVEPFEQPLRASFEVRLAPAVGVGAPQDDAVDVELDLDAPDPPDVLEGDAIDVAAYVAEHLALELDPFPRKPGAEFAYEPPSKEESPFAVLRNLKAPKP